MSEPIHCNHCMDSGYVWIDFDSESAWAHCMCECGIRNKAYNNFFLPVLTKQHLAVLKIREFPLSEFVPKQQIISDEAEMESSLIGMWEVWKKELKQSEKFWQSLQETQ